MRSAVRSTLNLPACPEIGNRAVAAIHAAYDALPRRVRGDHPPGPRAVRAARLARAPRPTPPSGWRSTARTWTRAVADVHDILQDAVMERTLWAAMRARHAPGARGRPDAELAQTFFNSVTRRVFSTVGVDAAIEYLDPVAGPAGARRAPLLRPRSGWRRSTATVIRRILERFEWSVPYASLRARRGASSARLIAEAVDAPGRAPARSRSTWCARCSTGTRAPTWSAGCGWAARSCRWCSRCCARSGASSWTRCC